MHAALDFETVRRRHARSANRLLAVGVLEALVSFAALFAFMILLLMTSIPLSILFGGLIASIVLAAVLGFVAWWDYRCPACGGVPTHGI